VEGDSRQRAVQGAVQRAIFKGVDLVAVVGEDIEEVDGGRSSRSLKEKTKGLLSQVSGKETERSLARGHGRRDGRRGCALMVGRGERGERI
jgi:hypothetical protein